ncbi:MAG TPA: protein kinase, partial [Polyangiaceae bacterium]|nr:protein kinase [Polyangiaceae bacterium]
GMGAVLRANDRLLGRAVALKVLAEPGDQEGLLRRFVVEAQLGAQLEHPNIVPFYEFLATAAGGPAFAMKLVDGETLDAYLDECSRSRERARTAPHDLFSRLDRFLKVCDAMDYAHARGVVHRDLKPANVMLGLHNEVYVMDWGIARVLDDPPDGAAAGLRPPDMAGLRPPDAAAASGLRRTLPALGGLTGDGDVLGTPAYMAPEQARAEPISAATDQYALGMMLAELLTLAAPRGGTPKQQLADALLGRPPLLVPRFGEALPRELVAVVGKATALDPGQRYASVAELAADVRRFVRDEAVSVLPDRAWLRLWRRLKRHPLAALGTLGACVLFSLVVLVAGLWRELQARKTSALESEHIFALTAAVDRTARGVDARFRRIELLLEGLARSASEVLERPAEGAPASPAGLPAPLTALAPLAPADLATLSLGTWLDRYAQNVSFDRSVYVRSPNVPLGAIEPVLGRLGDFEPLLVSTSARAAAGDEALGYDEAARRAVARDRSPILWTDLAFESGVVLVYPGNWHFPAGFETRERSWYTNARSSWAPVWGSPYPDATSGQLIIACSTMFPGADGKLAGVAALHVRLEEVLSSLAISGVEGYQSSALLDAAANVVLSERTREVRLSGGLHANRALERTPFEVPEVRAAIAAGAREGRVQSGDRMTVFERLDTGGWLLAVTVESAPYDLR